jgi:hypothetical protein
MSRSDGINLQGDSQRYPLLAALHSMGFGSSFGKRGRGDDVIVKAGLRQAKSHVRLLGHALGDRDHPASREVDPQHVIAPFDLHHWQISEVEKCCAAERNVVSLAPPVSSADRDAGHRPAIEMQGICVLGRHIAQACPVFGAEARESGLRRHVGQAGCETRADGGMKPPLQPFAFAARLHG